MYSDVATNAHLVGVRGMDSLGRKVGRGRSSLPLLTDRKFSIRSDATCRNRSRTHFNEVAEKAVSYC